MTTKHLQGSRLGDHRSNMLMAAPSVMLPMAVNNLCISRILQRPAPVAVGKRTCLVGTTVQVVDNIMYCQQHQDFQPVIKAYCTNQLSCGTGICTSGHTIIFPTALAFSRCWPCSCVVMQTLLPGLHQAVLWPHKLSEPSPVSHLEGKDGLYSFSIRLPAEHASINFY